MRVEAILRIRLEGAKFWDVRGFVREMVEAADPVWLSHGRKVMLSDCQLERYVKMSDELIEASCEPNRAKRIKQHLAKRAVLYAKAMAVSDYRTALAVAADEAKLQGDYAAERVEHSGPGGEPIEIREVVVTTREDAANHIPPVASTNGFHRQPCEN